MDNQLALKFVTADPKIPLSLPSKNTVKTGISCPQPKTQLRHTLNFTDFFEPPLRKKKPLRENGGQPAGLPKSFCRLTSGLVFGVFLQVFFFFLPFSVSLCCVRPCSFQCLCLSVCLFECFSSTYSSFLEYYAFRWSAISHLMFEQKHNLKSGKQR